jgi:anti-anti-sigma regulatory factor
MTLRIQRSKERGWVVFTLTGRIQADLIPELQGLLRSEISDHHVVLDLKEVRLVDLDAVRFLAKIETEGARLVHCSAFIREWISQERKSGAQQVQESKTQERTQQSNNLSAN